MQSEGTLLHISTASPFSPGTCWTLTLVLIFSPQVKQGGPWTKINLFCGNTANALHFKSFQFCSTFFTSEFAFPTTRSSPNFFQAFLGQQVPDSHSKICMVFTSPWQYLQAGEWYRTARAPAGQNALLCKLEATLDLSKTQHQPRRHTDVQESVRKG